MRSAKRVIAATALGLPILLGAPGMALADGGHHKGWPTISDNQLQNQDQDANTEQANLNKPTQYTFNVGSGEANSVSWSNQANDADTEQSEAAWQADED
ncbi:hypothetical protein [Saccharopolyspora pogona]|uniref:hypothetical protein n=1 Tax=Saccharopolyspora pogona TaxID=333966 RepID=UPI001683E421|nr:hypothetical protein [Saccharopolyspora pogona]